MVYLSPFSIINDFFVVWFFSAKLFDKSPSNNLNVPWHQSINPLITIWIPLDPVSSKNGCLTVKPGFNKTLLPQLRDGTIDWSASGTLPLPIFFKIPQAFWVPLTP